MAATIAIARPDAAHDQADVKLRATLAARLALAGGFVLHDLAAVEAFAVRVGAPS